MAQLKTILKQLEINSQYLKAYTNRGIAKDSLLDYTGAVSDYSAVIELDPDNAATLL